MRKSILTAAILLFIASISFAGAGSSPNANNYNWNGSNWVAQIADALGFLQVNISSWSAPSVLEVNTTSGTDSMTVYQGDNPWQVETSSDVSEITAYQGDNPWQVETSSDVSEITAYQGDNPWQTQTSSDVSGITVYQGDNPWQVAGTISSGTVYCYQGTNPWIVRISSPNDSVTVYQGDNPWNVTGTSDNMKVEVFAGETLPVSDAGGSFTIDTTSPNAGVTVYPGAGQEFPINDGGNSVTVDCSSPNAGVTIYQGDNPLQVTGSFTTDPSSQTVSFMIEDSTYVARNFYANGSMTINFPVKSIGAYSQGGTTQMTINGGDNIPIWDGIPFSDVPIDESFKNPVALNFTLTNPTTFTIYVRGKKND